MKRRKKHIASKIIIGIGTVLILSALLLFLHNKWEDRQAGKKAGETLSELQTIISAKSSLPEAADAADASGTPDTETAAPEGEMLAPPMTGSALADAMKDYMADSDFSPEEYMPAVTVNEIQYIGVIAIPALGVELPVMSRGNLDQLNIAPCRQFGSAATDNLVIAAHNYNSFFGRIDSLLPGDTVTFTDINGTVYNYAVVRGQLLETDQVAEVQNSGYPLGIYTCAYDGTLRFIVFCERA